MSHIKPFILALAIALLGSTMALAAEPVDINTASAQELAAAISGVGTRKAEAIIADRQQNGPFRSVDDLARVRGVGPKMIENSRKNLTVR